MASCVILFFAVFFLSLQTLSVLNPVRQMDSDSLKDSDLAGPLLFCLLFGVILLLVRTECISQCNHWHRKKYVTQKRLTQGFMYSWGMEIL